MKIKILGIIAILIFAISCKKSKDNNTTPNQASYLTNSSGSTWNYQQTDSSTASPVTSDYTLTSSSRDTMINNKIYHVFSISSGGNQYLNKTGNDYYQFDSLPRGFGSGAIEELYLEDSAYANTSWSQTQTISITGSPFPVPFTISYTIAERNITRTVNNINYSNVIHVYATLSSSLIPAASLTSSINSYYAPKVGLIERSTQINLNYLGIVANVNLSVKLVNSTLK